MTLTFVWFDTLLVTTHTHTHPFYGPLDFVQDYPSEPVPEPICRSAPCHRQIIMPAPHRFTGRMPFLLPNQKCQSTLDKPVTTWGICH